MPIDSALNWIDVLKILFAVVLALLPAFIWLQIIYSKNEKNPKFILWIFLCGALTVLPILFMQWLWSTEPLQQFDVYKYLEKDLIKKGYIPEVVSFIFISLAVGIIEESVKYIGLRYIDATKIKIQTINDSLKYIIVIALGFAFSENILYFSHFLSDEQSNISNMFYNITFRSIVTTCAHMVFAGLIGYYYAFSKFAKPIFETAVWEGEKFQVLRFFAKMLWMDEVILFAFLKRIKGLFIAIFLHASFDFCMLDNKPQGGLIIVILGFVLIYYLMNKKTGELIFNESGKHQSEMATKDEEVVIELLGMWLNEGKYKDVVAVCDRLLQKDPDSSVVKLFKAKAYDKLKVSNTLRAIHGLFSEKVEEDEAYLDKLKKLKDQRDNSQIPPQSSIPKITAITPENEKVITELLEMWLSEGKNKEVSGICDRILKTNPNHKKIKEIKKHAMSEQKINKVYGTIRSLFSKEDYEEEESLFEKYKKIKKNN